VLGKLFGSRMGLGYLELKTDEETQQQYQQFLQELQNIEKEIREVSHQLSNDISTSETSFVNAVNQLLKEKRKLGKFESQLILDKNYDWKQLDGIIEMNLFRILQECLQNILKHAEANNVVISFTIEKDNLLVEIKDDGIGFDTSKKKKGIGLKNIKSRVADLRGDVKISSEVNN
jgi:signal transduction histidine kinase